MGLRLDAAAEGAEQLNSGAAKPSPCNVELAALPGKAAQLENEMTRAQIQLGQTYKDKITGFEGVATGHVRYISGCNQVLLAPRVGPDGTAKDAHWFDEQRLDCQQQDVIVLDNGATPGCDLAAPKR